MIALHFGGSLYHTHQISPSPSEVLIRPYEYRTRRVRWQQVVSATLVGEVGVESGLSIALVLWDAVNNVEILRSAVMTSAIVDGLTAIAPVTVTRPDPAVATWYDLYAAVTGGNGVKKALFRGALLVE